MLPVCYPSSPSPTTGLPEAVAYALSSVSGLTRWVDYIPIKLVSGALGVNEQSTNVGGFTPMRLLGSAIGMAAWSDYIPVYVDNSATEAWVTSATGYIPYANSVGMASEPSYYLNLTIPGGSPVTIADGQARGTITSTYNAVITASMSPSRITGVAPLYVNFDMTGTTSTDSTNPTHECFFATDFGDTGAGTWANGVQSSGLTSKNAGYGPVTGHVYETPGTYTVTMSVTDGVNTVTKTGTIVVQDPDVVYAGTDTICISHSGNFTGAPSGASQINTAGNTDMYAALVDHEGSDKRILFCKADAWTFTQQYTVTNKTGLTIGGYGTGIARSFGSGTLIPVTPTYSGTAGEAMFLCYTGNSDLRVCDMAITAGKDHSAMSATKSTVGLLFSKVEIRGAYTGFNVNGRALVSDCVVEQACFYECLFDDPYGFPFIDTPSVSASITNGATLFASVGHGLPVGRSVKLLGSTPSPFALATTYYILADGYTADAFKLSLTSGGAAVTAAASGSCTVKLDSLSGGVGIYSALIQGGILGGYFDNRGKGEQVIRIPFIDRGHISNNYLARPNQAKNMLKINSVKHEDLAIWTEKFVIGSNVFSDRNNYSYDGVTTTATPIQIMGIGSGGNTNPDGSGGEWVRNGIVENNYAQGCLGAPGAELVFALISCPNMTLRNNVVDFSVGDRTTTSSTPYSSTHVNFVSVTTSTPDTTVGVRIYNNTLYSNLANASKGNFVIVTVPTGLNITPDEITVKNNLWYLPHHINSEKTAIYRYSGAGTNVVTENNTDSVAGGAAGNTPNFAVVPPVLLADWRPNTGSYAIDTGATVPVLRDFNNASRVGGPYDLGAVLP